MSKDLQFVVPLLPDVTAGGHLERVENRSLHEGIEGLAGYVLYNLLKVDNALARIAELLARPKVNFERLALRPPVGKASSVAEHYPGGDQVQPIVVLDIGPRQIPG